MKTSFCFEKDIEKIENYELAKADNFKGWVIHHRLETHDSDNNKRLKEITKQELIALGMYYYRPESELIFMRRGEHSRLHNYISQIGEKNRGSKRSIETKRKMAEIRKGSKHSEETKRKISEAMKGHKSPTKSRLWFTDGKISVMRFECPKGFRPGRV